MPTQEEVVEALRQVEDPELGMDIVELGLFYDAELEGDNVKVTYTLTSMGCPAGPMIQQDIHTGIFAVMDGTFAGDGLHGVSRQHREVVDAAFVGFCVAPFFERVDEFLIGGGFNRSLQHRPKSIGRRFKSQGFPGALV